MPAEAEDLQPGSRPGRLGEREPALRGAGSRPSHGLRIGDRGLGRNATALTSGVRERGAKECGQRVRGGMLPRRCSGTQCADRLVIPEYAVVRRTVTCAGGSVRLFSSWRSAPRSVERRRRWPTGRRPELRIASPVRTRCATADSAGAWKSSRSGRRSCCSPRSRTITLLSVDRPGLVAFRVRSRRPGLSAAHGRRATHSHGAARGYGLLVRLLNMVATFSGPTDKCLRVTNPKC